jgi:hypothetical protein
MNERCSSFRSKGHEEVKHKNVIRGICAESDGKIHHRVRNGLPLGLYIKKGCKKIAKARTIEEDMCLETH